MIKGLSEQHIIEIIRSEIKNENIRRKKTYLSSINEEGVKNEQLLRDAEGLV